MAGAPPPLLLLTTSCVLLALLHAAGAARLLLAAPGDADALLKLKAGIDDGGSGVLQSWAAGTSPCDGDASNWAGVMCHKGDVMGLQLENMGLSGKLDLGTLATLRGLRTLSFMDNHFAGPMPDIRDLDGLRAVFFSGNGFSGQIPADAFDGMGSLKKVYLGNNSFFGPIPASLAGMPRLLELRLNDNGFQGKIPDLPQKELKVVDVANNDLEGEIPPSLKSMNPAMFAGNKKLCGGSLGTKCSAPPTSPSPPAPEKAGTPSTPATPATPTPAVPQPDEKPTQNDAEKPTERSLSAGVLVALVGVLAIVGFALLALQRRREYNTENFGPAMSKKPSMRKINAEPAKLDTASAHADAPSPETAAAAAAAGGSSRAGGAARKAGAEQGRLTFVREDRGRFFELQDLLKATAEILGGSGNLGVCYRATLSGGEVSIVVKRFKEMNRVGREDFEEHMRRLGRLSHRNLLPLVAYYYRKEEKLLMHDYVPKRSLAHLLHGEGRGVKKAVVHWNARLKIVKGVARALGYMYDELPMLTVPHGHLKSSNILLNEEFEPLLTDYALVPVMNQSHAAQLMVAFKSPERKQFGKSSKKSDVWCLGLLILEVVTGKPPSYDTKPAATTGDSSGADQQPPQKQKSSAGSSANAVDLAGLVASTAEEEWLRTVVDGDMKYDEEEEGEEVVKLIRIGMACCEGNVESRWELKNAVERIEELKGKDRRGPGNEDNSFYSSVSGDGVADRDEDFGNVGIH
ncbi:pollen receptor-like kinase 4 [Brachypodium distachyon]|uniref:Protein kinase domain-containing protein n=1 Tax=Brachypodium distachyon TaxID=15368 RepID=I1I8L1_BRADI|nr:pollen receptor-like kinase 4 [Brachypodium distachyon]KQJ98986.1 hypothetical protein BRADI_3g40370v3 [Brachypodium distachyon]|eukprot:XP_003574774.1 pollen receptor-like kinase 4 [Brachypodium distachyon]